MAGVGEQVGISGAGVRFRTQGLTLLGLLLLLTVATRLPFIPEHLYSFDSVNFALALQDFDPSRNQPQPPGYPFFVAEARLIHGLAGTPERTTTFLKIVVTGASVALLYLLGRRLFSSWVGFVAAGLLFFNPPFWYAGLTSASRLHVALISLLVASFCWRACGGEHRYFYAASIAVGLGGGFRPELSLFLLPLWLWTAWQCRCKRLFLEGSLLFLVGTACWVLVLLAAYGGLGQMVSSFRDYLLEQSQSLAALAGGPAVEWRRMVGRAFLWNGLGILPWAWAIPLAWLYRRRFAHWNRQGIFLTVWFFPPFLFHSLVHIGSSGHALVTIPVLCLAGGLFIIEAQDFLKKRSTGIAIAIGLGIGITLLGNATLFFWPYPLPQRKEVTQFRGWASVRDAIYVGTYETSYARTRYIARTTDQAFRQIETLKSVDDKPLLLLWNRDAEPVWRKVTYYYPSYRLYELVGRRTRQPRARLWRGAQLLAAFSGSPHVRLAVPPKGRLIWLVHPDSVEELGKIIPLRGAFPAYYTDLKPDTPPFRWGSFEFVPE